MNFKLFRFLFLFFCSQASGAVVATYRGNLPDVFRFGSLSVSADFDVNADGIADYHFLRDSGFIAAFRSYGENRFISTLADPPDLGGYVDPVNAGSIIGSNTSSLLGNWYRHTDNGGGGGFGLNFGPRAMQYQNAYIGVEFKINGLTHYGWIQFEGFGHPSVVFPVYDEAGNIVFYVNAPSSQLGGRINSWAYETEPGKPIIAGAVPEPSSWILAGVATTSLLLLRRRE